MIEKNPSSEDKEKKKTEDEGGFNYAKEYAIQNQKIRKLNKQIAGYKSLEKRGKNKNIQENNEKTKDQPITTPKTETETHQTVSWLKDCPTCGEGNPDFKDETVCEGPSCGKHLGSIDTAKKLKSCPFCGSKKVKQIVKQ